MYRPVWVSVMVSDLNQNSGFGHTLGCWGQCVASSDSLGKVSVCRYTVFNLTEMFKIKSSKKCDKLVFGSDIFWCYHQGELDSLLRYTLVNWSDKILPKLKKLRKTINIEQKMSKKPCPT